jgi:anti-anti-sigma factor
VQCGEIASIALGGELDIATAPLAASVLERARLDACACCILDLRALTFVDGSGVRLLTQLAAAAQADNYALLIIPPVGGAAARMMQLQRMHLLLTYITVPPRQGASPPRRACAAPGARPAQPLRLAACREGFEHDLQP